MRHLWRVFDGDDILQIRQAAHHLGTQSDSGVAGVGDEYSGLAVIRYVAEIAVDLLVIVGHEIGIANRQIIGADTFGVMRKFNAFFYRSVPRMYHHRNAATALVKHDLGGTPALLRGKSP